MIEDCKSIDVKKGDEVYTNRDDIKIYIEEKDITWKRILEKMDLQNHFFLSEILEIDKCINREEILKKMKRFNYTISFQTMEEEVIFYDLNLIDIKKASILLSKFKNENRIIDNN